MEKSMIIIWNDSIKHKNLIIDEISKQFKITYITQENDIFIDDKYNKEFLTEFYWNNYCKSNFIKRKRFTSKFVIIFFDVINPTYIEQYNEQRKENVLVNENVMLFKRIMRETCRKDDKLYPLCHAPDDIKELFHNLIIISKYATINNMKNIINMNIDFCKNILDK
jgi:hypothetical protein